jgi:mono/diheme cytochrome c family protein
MSRSSAALAAMALALAGCRYDMQDQPKAKTFRASAFYDDRLSARPLVAGTVAQGEADSNDLLHTGMVNGQLTTVFPFPVTPEVLQRGRERYTIYCAPCHGPAGEGDGMIVRRGLRAPPAFSKERLRRAPVGHFFDVMTHGFGSMYDYSDRVRPRDRWAITAYIRALQLRAGAALEDLPGEDRQKIGALP